MNKNNLELIIASINNTKPTNLELQESDLDELIEQTIYCLPADYLDDISMPNDVSLKWRNLVYNQIQKYYSFLLIQDEITRLLEPKGIIPVVLKGMSSAIYYEHPEYRVCGDIDIILMPNTEENVNRAVELLESNGYTKDLDLSRHISFNRNGVVIELHRFFSTRMYQGEIVLDEIIDNARHTARVLSGTTFYTFDDITNGLVLLQHIEQHINSGLGFRQIIDWLVFAENCLYGNEENSKQYINLAESVGLKQLAIYVQRLGELYFDMPTQEWSRTADEEVTGELYDLINNYGNFGEAQDYVGGGITRVLSNGGFTPIGLQRRGMNRWEAAKKHRVLRPFAWAYQLGRDVKVGIIGYTNKTGRITDNIKESKKRLELLEELGAGKYRE